jgi:hypothetical protein
MSDDATRDAIRLTNSLVDLGKYLHVSARVEQDPAKRQLMVYDSKTCQDAAQMLQKLGTEVVRLREGIGCFHYGKLNERDLYGMSQNWNGES